MKPWEYLQAKQGGRQKLSHQRICEIGSVLVQLQLAEINH